MEPDDSVDFAAVRETFRAEAGELIALLEEAILAFEYNPDDSAPLDTMFRAAHTIKGGARMVGLDRLAELMHVFEDVLDALRSARLAPSQGTTTLLLETVDALRQIVPAAMGGATELSAAHELLRDRLRALVKKESAAESSPGSPAAVSPTATAGPGAPAALPAQARTIRVSVEKLDHLLDLVGEIAIARGRMTDLLETQCDLAREPTLEAHCESDLLYMDLQELSMKLRMVPLGPLFHEYLRTVRDLALDTGKNVRVAIEGDDVEVDTTVVEHLRDPLLHLVRNAVHHGVELPTRRLELGKPEIATITLRGVRSGGSIAVVVQDDGAGLDRSRILEAAHQKGLVAPDAEPTDAEIDRLVLLPGLSTAESVTEISGRGVGMDVVIRNTELLRGTVSVATEPGRGTSFTMRFPLTLAIIEGFRVAVDDEVYVFPMESVVECLELPAGTRMASGGWGVSDVRGAPLPFLDLRHLFHLPGKPPRRESLLVVRRGGKEAGIAVDVLMGAAQIVIKPLGRMFQGLPGLAGTAIMGNGKPAFVLDVPTLLDEACRRYAEASSAQASAEAS